MEKEKKKKDLRISAESLAAGGKTLLIFIALFFSAAPRVQSNLGKIISFIIFQGQGIREAPLPQTPRDDFYPKSTVKNDTYLFFYHAPLEGKEGEKEK